MILWPARRWRRRLAGLIGAAAVVASLTACVMFPARAGSVPAQQRRLGFPATGHDLHGTVTVRWDDRLVPFIEASDDRDVPYTLGLVHAYLRRGEMELLRLAAQGRLSEAGGPFAVEIDRAIRIIGIPRSAAGVAAALRPDTRAWVERYLAGINTVVARGERPWEMRIGGIADQPWTVEDIAAISRLAAVDPNWFAVIAHARLIDDPRWAAARGRLLRAGGAVAPSFPGTWTLDPLNLIGRTGSNAFAVAGWRRTEGAADPATVTGSATVTGPATGTARGALLATDPHLGLGLPSTWLALGWRSPAGAVAGLTVPGLPVVLLGRNEHLAWGGTNMYGAASALYDASSLPIIEERRETLHVRGWFDEIQVLRLTSRGALLEGDLLTRTSRPLALWWRGHQPSDELSAFLDANRARSWEEFQAAFATYAVSAQNLICAGADGRIGQLAAFTASPGASRALSAGLGDPARPDHDPLPGVASRQLPAIVDPPSGVLWSSNNPPAITIPPLAPLAYEDERASRFRELLAGRVSSIADLARIQLDVFAPRAQALARALAGHPTAATQPALRALLQDWDGQYLRASRGAAAYHATVRALSRAHFRAVYGEAVAASLLRTPAMPALLAEDLAAGACDAVLAEALAAAARTIAKHPTWGDLHRLRVGHWLADLPLLGSRLMVRELPADGAMGTINKAASGAAGSNSAAGSSGDEGPERVVYGANARVLCDLADPDGLWLVLCGGQDGWIGSTAFADQVDDFQAGRTHRLPLSPTGVAAAFPHAVRLGR